MADDAEKTIPNQEKKSYVNPFLQIVGDGNEMLLDDTPYLPVVNMVSLLDFHPTIIVQIYLSNCLSIPGEVKDLDVLAGELSEGEGDDCGPPRGD